MITISDAARHKIQEIMMSANRPFCGLRVISTPASPTRMKHNLLLIEKDEVVEEDNVVKFDEFDVFISPETAPHAENLLINYIDTSMGGRIIISQKVVHRADVTNPRIQEIQDFIDQQINPQIALHGGYVCLVDVKDNSLYLEMGGGCQGCSMASQTFTRGVEYLLKQQFPEINDVYDMTDHQDGNNPYC